MKQNLNNIIKKALRESIEELSRDWEPEFPTGTGEIGDGTPYEEDVQLAEEAPEEKTPEEKTPVEEPEIPEEKPLDEPSVEEEPVETSVDEPLNEEAKRFNDILDRISKLYD